jgi:hypothetical protein
MKFLDKYHSERHGNKIVNEITSTDGKVQRIFQNGKKEVIFTNGVKREVHPDGYQVVFFTN